ncbi:unnamed protein product [Rotaria sp. Silwood2]|nr:unnamed protein product [Rotaria sp. Silwood2]CAF3930797.1 unnamed protein product [Rotaria sp. Silwood2]
MQSPNNSEGSGPSIDFPRRSSSNQSQRILSTRQHPPPEPNLNPHQHLLNRTEENCPSHLKGSKCTQCLKAARKTRANLQLIQQLPLFFWPTSHYHAPIFIHHLTSSSTIISTLEQTRDVTVYHYIVAWGDVFHELSSFQQCALLGSSHIQRPLNLQDYFTNQWNRTYPHLSSCPTQQHQVQFDTDSEVDLICHVDSYDLHDDLSPTRVTLNANTCTCPDTIRQYKNNNEQWTLQKAIQYILNGALYKTHTMNTWSCGFDPQLITNQTTEAIHTRDDMTLYAINDVFATTKFLFHFNHEIIAPYYSSNASTSDSTTNEQPPALSSYFVLSGSHAKHIDTPLTTP